MQYRLFLSESPFSPPRCDLLRIVYDARYNFSSLDVGTCSRPDIMRNGCDKLFNRIRVLLKSSSADHPRSKSPEHQSTTQSTKFTSSRRAPARNLQVHLCCSNFSLSGTIPRTSVEQQSTSNLLTDQVDVLCCSTDVRGIVPERENLYNFAGFSGWRTSTIRSS